MIPSYHPKLVERIISQTLQAVIGFTLLTMLYVWVFIELIPPKLLSIWFMSASVFVFLRYMNSKALAKHIKENDIEKIKIHTSFLLFLIIYSAIVWSSSAILASVYAPTPYEFFSLIMLVGISSAGALTLNPFFHIYMIFFVILTFTEIGILFYLGERIHMATAMMLIISLPIYYSFSKSIYQDSLQKIKMNTTLEKNVHELRHLSVTDPLTNISNRRHFFLMSERLIALSEREKQTLSLLMIDIDNFKNINDTYGHQAGDNILIMLAEKIDKMTRESDIFARIGGEEFALLLGNTSTSGAKVIADKLCKAIENKLFQHNEIKINVTISIGIAEMSKEKNSLKSIFSKADKNLYKAKEQGRNRACA
jgi:diguanylate cyclase (GGDEF)-like protein